MYGIKEENIVGHYEAHAAGYGSNHSDPKPWQKKHSGSMAQFRASVAALINGNTSPSEPVISKAEETPVETPKPVQTAPETAQNGSVVIPMITLRKGSRGTQVKVLQWLLSLNGYNVGTVDGIFGANTQKAVKAYQTAKGLSSDGIVGKNTWSKLLT